MIFISIIFGLLIGSFLNVCIYRLPAGESIAFPPSRCPKCDTRLKPVDLMPVLSFVLTRGKCRYCGEGISIQYPLIESLNGLMYGLAYLKYGFTAEGILFSLLMSLLIVISVVDLRTMEIPYSLNITGALLGITYIFSNWNGISSATSGLLGLLLGTAVFALIILVTNGAMGGGDMLLAGMLGIWFGWQNELVIIMTSFITGAAISLFLISFKIKGRKDFIPFGPFICLGAVFAMFFGDSIISWYARLLF